MTRYHKKRNIHLQGCIGQCTQKLQLCILLYRHQIQDTYLYWSDILMHRSIFIHHKNIFILKNFFCWQIAGFYHYYGIQKQQLPEKLFGLYSHKVQNRKVPLVRGFDDYFLAPHSRHTETPAVDIHNCDCEYNPNSFSGSCCF